MHFKINSKTKGPSYIFYAKEGNIFTIKVSLYLTFIFIDTEGKKPFSYNQKLKVWNTEATKLNMTIEFAEKIELKIREKAFI